MVKGALHLGLRIWEWGDDCGLPSWTSVIIGALIRAPLIQEGQNQRQSCDDGSRVPRDAGP